MILLDYYMEGFDFSSRHSTCPRLDSDLPRKDVSIKQKKKFRVLSNKLVINCHMIDLTIRRAKRGKKVRAYLQGIANMSERSTVELECRDEGNVPEVRFKLAGCFGEVNLNAVVEIPTHIDEVVVAASSNTVVIEDGDYTLMEAEVRGGDIVSSVFADRLRLESVFKGSIFASIDMIRDCSLELASDEGNLLVCPRNVSEVEDVGTFYSEYPSDIDCATVPGGHKLSISGYAPHSKLTVR